MGGAVLGQWVASAGLALMLGVFANPSANAAGAKPADPELGAKISGEICAACHGADGNSALPINPNLAAQHPEYLIKQLSNFSSVDGAPPLRENAIMAGFAAQLSPDDQRNLAAHFSRQKLTPAVAGQRDLIELGQQIYRGGIAAKGVPSCAGCHGPTGAGIPSQYPRIWGQHAEYTAGQLTAFRQGTRKNNSQMTAIAARLSDSEIKALAEYVAGLR